MLNGLIGRSTMSGIVARAAIADTWGAAQKLPMCFPEAHSCPKLRTALISECSDPLSH